MAAPEQPAKVESCVFCRRHPVDPAWKPFCSERCKLIDLGRWAGGEYRIPSQEKPSEEIHRSNGQSEDND